MNKVDIADDDTIKEVKNKYKNVITMSVKNNINLDVVVEEIKNRITSMVNPYIGTNITQERHRNELLKAVNALKEIDFNLPIEIVAEKIRVASFCIGTITGRINTEEILDNIFSRFCIGK